MQHAISARGAHLNNARSHLSHIILLRGGVLFSILIHSKLRSITPVITKVHVILRSFVVLTWMRDTIELV